MLFKTKQDRDLRRGEILALPLLAETTLQRSDQQTEIFGERGCTRRPGHDR